MSLNIDDILESERFRRVFPPFAAFFFATLFVVLGTWQLDRAAEKKRVLAMFEDDANYVAVSADMPVVEFQNIEARGRYLAAHQFLVDNAIVDGRVGFYVLTAFRYAAGAPLLIVNRGWIPRAADLSKPDLQVAENGRAVRGRTGLLPRIGIRAGEVFRAQDDWPKLASYPTLEDLSGELGVELMPFVMLLDPRADDGFVRRWQPGGSGPMKHYSYALQWFAMAAAVGGFFYWRWRKKA